MPIQGSGAISITDLVSEFGGQAPHSLTEYYRNSGLVDSTRNVTGSATKSDGGTTTDFAGVTGLSVSRTTGTVSASNMSLSSGNQVIVPAGAYVDFTIRRRGGRNSSTSISRGNISQGPDAQPVYNSGWLIYESTLSVGGGSGSGLEVRSQHSVYSGPFIQTSHSVLHARMSSSNEAAYGVPVRHIDDNSKNFYVGSANATQGEGEITELLDHNQVQVAKNSGFANLPVSNTARTKHRSYLTGSLAGTTYRLLRVDVSLRIRGYNNSGSSKTLTFSGNSTMSGQSIGGSTTNNHTPVNNLSITANSGGSQTVYTYAVTNNTGSSGTVTVGGVDTVIANGATTNVSTNNSSSSLAISFQSTVTLNSGVPTSGSAISLKDFYGAEEQ